jgi:fission process protein 1
LDQKELEQLDDDIKTTDSSLRVVGYGGALAAGVRYAAYVSDVGEAFRPVVGRAIVRAAYATSWSYVIGDVAWETHKAWRRGDRDGALGETIAKRATFQVVASMALPAFAIHSTVHVTQKLCNRFGRFQRWGPSVAGLALVCYALAAPLFVDWLTVVSIECDERSIDSISTLGI